MITTLDVAKQNLGKERVFLRVEEETMDNSI